MKRLLYISLIFFFSLTAWTADAQKKSKFDFEAIYRPVYGYLVDSLTNQPFVKAAVYAFDSIEDARLGEAALQKSRNPLSIKLKGDVVETFTDESGRYMVPARNTGALIFYFKDRKEIIIEEVAGRSEISRGRRASARSYDDVDISKFLSDDYGKAPEKMRRKGPEGVSLDMNFKASIPLPGDKGKDARITVERRIVDVETGEILSSCIPIARDGRAYHKQRRKMIAKGEIADSLYEVAGNYPFLSDTTSSIRIVDHVNTEPWKDQCFRLGYFISMEHAGTVRPVDTLYMMTNRVNKPLKYLEYKFDPYHWEIEETTEQRRSVTRRLVLEGEYDGQIPEVLKDSSYVLRELHIKAVVAQNRPYEECIALADSLVEDVMGNVRTVFADKLNNQVRLTKTSQVSPDTSYRNNVTYKYIFTTGRQFSRNEYLRQIKKAKDDGKIERLCRQAMEERKILEGTTWDYAANVLAALYIRQGRIDTTMLAPFIDRSLLECDIAIEDPVTFEMVISNRREIVGNQVLMLMLADRYEEAAELAEMLPSEFACIREVALCKGGKTPSDKTSKDLLKKSSLRNEVLVEMLEEELDPSVIQILKDMPEDDAMTWYLRARAYCMLYNNESWEMQAATIEGTGHTVYAHVLGCLRKCFALDKSMETVAKYDSEINEYALKEVLGVYVL